MEQRLSVILIAHNEEQSMGPMLKGLLSSYDREILEVIVVDDASKDRTAEIVRDWAKDNPKIRLIQRTPPCGVGRALKRGFGNISPRSEYALTMDCDFVENIAQVRGLLDAIEKQDCDGVIGSRFVQGGKVVGYPLLKRLMNRLFHVVVRTLFQIRQNDLTNNFKLYKARIFQSMPWKSDGFALNAETGIWPILFGYKLIEVPVVWVERAPGMGKSKFDILKHGAAYIRVVFNGLQLVSKQRARTKK